MSRGVWFMLLAIFFFSLMNLGVKMVAHLPTFELVFSRSLIAGIMAFTTLRYRKINPWGNRKDLLILRGVLGFIALSAFFLTVQNMRLATAVTVQYLSPIFVAIWGIIFLKESMKPIQWVWFALSFLGVILIKGFDEQVDGWFLAIGIGSAIVSGMGYTVIRKLRQSDHPIVVTLFFPLVAVPLAGVCMIFDFEMPQGWDWLYLLATGVFAQLGQVFMTKALHYEKANIVGSMIYLGILFAIPYGIFLFHETYSVYSLTGIFLIFAGVGLNVLAGIRENKKAS